MYIVPIKVLKAEPTMRCLQGPQKERLELLVVCPRVTLSYGRLLWFYSSKDTKVMEKEDLKSKMKYEEYKRAHKRTSSSYKRLLRPLKIQIAPQLTIAKCVKSNVSGLLLVFVVSTTTTAAFVILVAVVAPLLLLLHFSTVPIASVS
uniref:Uncharacterized protein n=1 Tax=Glossina austeni TaxID=7395 RepID=A0A1A9VB72_GLOAU